MVSCPIPRRRRGEIFGNGFPGPQVLLSISMLHTNPLTTHQRAPPAKFMIFCTPGAIISTPTITIHESPRYLGFIFIIFIFIFRGQHRDKSLSRSREQMALVRSHYRGLIRAMQTSFKGDPEMFHGAIKEARTEVSAKYTTGVFDVSFHRLRSTKM